MDDIENAHAALRRWRDQSTPLELLLEYGPRGPIVFARCVVAKLERSSVALRNKNLHIGLLVDGAKFTYENILARIPADADMSLRHGVCEVRIKLSSGPMAILSEMAGEES